MKAKLIVVGGDAKPTEIDLTLPSVIGRGRSATLTLPHPLVSREHCEIYLSEGRLHVRDLGSLNGTYIGNERVEDAALPAGGLLTVGTVTFRAVYEDPAAEADVDDLSFSVSDADSDSDELTVGPDAPLSSRTTAMLAPGEAGPEESETDALERILESLNETPSSPDASSEQAATEDVSTNEIPAADESDDMFPPTEDASSGAEDGKADEVVEDDDDFHTFLKNHS
ncbi:MAG TPA: FHA domain-containing protein [Planctomycetaceae bacterium]|nr:FHA domain-containing protein [Planctomycetaceae bacterium]